jgi:hypothetical protein
VEHNIYIIMSSNGNSNGKIQFVGKTALMKELQRTIAFRAYNSLLSSGDSKSAKELQAKTHTLYFGNPRDEDSMGYAEQLCCGMGCFSAMFDKEEDLAKGTIKLVAEGVLEKRKRSKRTSHDLQLLWHKAEACRVKIFYLLHPLLSNPLLLPWFKRTRALIDTSNICRKE